MNLLEYAFGLNPTQASSLLQLPQPLRMESNAALSFTASAGVSGITYGAEWSTTLAPESWSPIADTGSGSTHTFSVPIAAYERMFL